MTLNNLNYVLSPLDQFEVRDLLSINANLLGNVNLSLTNIGLYLTISIVIILTYSLLASNNNKIIPNNWSISQESIYATVHGIVVSQINPTKGQIYFPFIYTLFVPSGCPLALLPLLVLIEFVSYLSRNVSLGLRLAANILSGHMLLSILSGFTYNIMTNGFIFFFLGLIPLAFIIAFSGLELAIAFIQAQVFVILTCSYIKDGLDLH